MGHPHRSFVASTPILGRNASGRGPLSLCAAGVAALVRGARRSPRSGASARIGNGGVRVLQGALKEKFWGTGSGNLTELEKQSTNKQRSGIRCTPYPQPPPGSGGFGRGDRIQATIVFGRM